MGKSIKVHIKIADGIWYAFSGNNNYRTRQALVPAISYCNRMNQQQRRKVR